MPIPWAPANPTLDEREVLRAMLDREPETVTDRPGLLLIADKGFASTEFEAALSLGWRTTTTPLVQAGEASQGRVFSEVGAAVDRVGERPL